MPKKINYKVFAECIKENASLTCRKGDKTLLGTIRSQSNANVFANTMQNIYKPEFFKITVE